MTILRFGNWRLHNGPVMAAQVLEGVRELAGLQEQLEREYRHKRHELEATLQAERAAAVARGYEDGNNCRMSIGKSASARNSAVCWIWSSNAPATGWLCR